MRPDSFKRTTIIISENDHLSICEQHSFCMIPIVNESICYQLCQWTYRASSEGVSLHSAPAGFQSTIGQNCGLRQMEIALPLPCHFWQSCLLRKWNSGRLRSSRYEISGRIWMMSNFNKHFIDNERLDSVQSWLSVQVGRMWVRAPVGFVAVWRVLAPA